MPSAAQEALLTALNSGSLGEGRVALAAREQALLAYADKLTLTPASITRDDIDRMRDAGLDDRAIHDACAIVAYFAFVNRIADGLGVELEAPEPGGEAPA